MNANHACDLYGLGKEAWSFKLSEGWDDKEAWDL
ncbi:hypothetical protein BRC2024_KCUCJSVR_CDS_0101 [Acinetobacter phage vB_AbaM_KissB]